MFMKLFLCVVIFLTLVDRVHGSVAPIAECTTRAWVRAPDLTPNSIIHGDARVRISAECPAVNGVSLGLRFKERSFVKALRSREDAKRLNLEPVMRNLSDASPWALRPSRFANKSVEEAYEETIRNKDLWVVREEERLVFETTQPINIGNGSHGVLHDAVQDFTVLVPSTNFPPIPDTVQYGFSSFIEHEIVRTEWIYEYFAQVSFSGGTTKEVFAGFTAFQPLHGFVGTSPGLASATAVLEPLFGYRRENTANYSLEFSADPGLTFFVGTKNHVVTAVVTRTGLARTSSAPLRVSPCAMMTVLSPKWAAEYHIPNNLGRYPIPNSVLRAIPDRGIPRSQTQCSREATVILPNSTLQEIEANEIVTTKSAAFTISIGVNDAHTPTFETYYQTLTNSLTFSLHVETFRGEDGDADPDDLLGEHERHFGSGPLFEDDEEPWVPWEKMKKVVHNRIWRSYSGRIPIVVHPMKDRMSSRGCTHASTDTLAQAVMSDKTACEQSSLVHYLDEGARAPIFVDRDVVHELLAENPVERDLRAPVLKPVVSSPPKGEELVNRYYSRNIPGRPFIYVGATWAKKVANKNKVSSAMTGSD